MIRIQTSKDLAIVLAAVLAAAAAAPAVAQFPESDDTPGDEGLGVELGLSVAEETAVAEESGLSLTGGIGTDLSLPDEAESLLEIQELIGQKHLTDALKKADALLDAYPFSLSTKVAKAVILTELFRYREALDILNLLMERYPDDAAIMNNIAWIYATADDPTVRNGDRAVELGQYALLRAPGSYHIWSTMAEGYYVSGNYERALKAATEAMRMAVRQKASSENLREYREQLTKSYLAVEALSLLD